MLNINQASNYNKQWQYITQSKWWKLKNWKYPSSQQSLWQYITNFIKLEQAFILRVSQEAQLKNLQNFETKQPCMKQINTMKIHIIEELF